MAKRNSRSRQVEKEVELVECDVYLELATMKAQSVTSARIQKRVLSTGIGWGS